VSIDDALASDAERLTPLSQQSVEAALINDACLVDDLTCSEFDIATLSDGEPSPMDDEVDSVIDDVVQWLDGRPESDSSSTNSADVPWMPHLTCDIMLDRCTLSPVNDGVNTFLMCHTQQRFAIMSTLLLNHNLNAVLPKRDTCPYCRKKLWVLNTSPLSRLP